MKSYIKFSHTPNSRPANFKEDMQFFRKGQIGDWKNYFTEEMFARLKVAVERNLKYKGYIDYGV